MKVGDHKLRLNLYKSHILPAFCSYFESKVNLKVVLSLIEEAAQTGITYASRFIHYQTDIKWYYFLSSRFC